MTHARNHHLVVEIVTIAIAIAITLALSTTTAASARTFNFNSRGSLVQQPLPPEWACDMSRALGNRTSPCRELRVR
jgi:hypothetical protein